jgi:hypothetical protein
VLFMDYFARLAKKPRNSNIFALVGSKPSFFKGNVIKVSKSEERKPLSSE